MFADMRGFTAISEKLNPVEVVTLLNEFFALLTEITFEYDGTVFNMAGDGLMVGFGVPIEQADGSARAIAAARRMLDKFAVLAEQWRERYGVETGLGIGINVGEVIAGNVGSAAYMNYTIIGDTVNVASRLGQRARAGEMLFSDAVKHSLDEHGVSIGALPLPALVLRGRSTPIDIFCVPSVTRRLDLSAASLPLTLATFGPCLRCAHTPVRFSIYRPRPVPGVGRRDRALAGRAYPFPPAPPRVVLDRLNRSGGSLRPPPAGGALNRTGYIGKVCEMTTQLLDSAGLRPPAGAARPDRRGARPACDATSRATRARCLARSMELSRSSCTVRRRSFRPPTITTTSAIRRTAHHATRVTRAT